MGDSPAAVLFNVDGYDVDTIDTDGYNRLQVESSIAPGSIIGIDGDVSITAALPITSLSDIFIQDLKNGGSNNLLVNGSVTPVEFVINADSSNDILIYEIRFVFVADEIKLGENKFGKIDIINGIKLEIKSNGITTEIVNIVINEDFFKLYSKGGTFIDHSGNKDILTAGIYLSGVGILKAGSSDFIKITIRDTLNISSNKLFTCTVHGVKE